MYHEATTFSPEVADLQRFSPPSYCGETLLKHPGYIEGFVRIVSEDPEVELVPLESFGEVVGLSAVGWITREAYEHYIALILRDLKAALPVDAVYLSLHGAAAVEGVARPEADLAKRVREVVGSNVPIAGTFDPHGNEDEAFLEYADFSLAAKYYPHYDIRLQGERAATLLLRTVRGAYKPTSATRRPGIITPTVVQWTGQKPWSDIVQRALIWEARKADVYVSIFFGYPWSDVPDVGATVQVMTNNDQALADEIAEDMAAYMHRRRSEMFGAEILSPRQAVRRAVEAHAGGETPVVLADYSDRAGDATFILAEVLEQGLTGVLVATLRDELLLASLSASGARAGDPFDRLVGGRLIPGASGKPVRIRGTLRYFGQPPAGFYDAPANVVAIVEFGAGNYLVITSELVQITSPDQLDWAPIETDRVTTWAIKSRVHFRRGFDDNGFAKTILIVDAPEPYLGTVHLDQLPYRHVDIRKLYPYNEPGNTIDAPK